MKFAIAYYLLLIYTTVIIKPIIPVAEDALFHCFAEAYHVATVHAVYGNNHLEKQEANASDDNTNNSAKDILKTEDIVTSHIPVVEENYILPITNAEIFFYMQPSSPLHKIVISKLAPPPKFA